MLSNSDTLMRKYAFEISPIIGTSYNLAWMIELFKFPTGDFAMVPSKDMLVKLLSHHVWVLFIKRSGVEVEVGFETTKTSHT